MDFGAIIAIAKILNMQIDERFMVKLAAYEAAVLAAMQKQDKGDT